MNLGKTKDQNLSDVHAHGFLSAPLSVYEGILGKKLPEPPRVYSSFEDFNRYLFENLIPAIRDLEALRLIVRGAFEQWIADGVTYVEPSFDAMVVDFLQIRLSDWVQMLHDEMQRVSPKLCVRPEIGINRTVPVNLSFSRIKEWISTGLFRSIDLYDDENAGNLAEFVPLYHYAKDKGLKLKAHAGELCGAEKVMESVTILELDAVQHGIRAIEDPRVVEVLVKKNVTLNICPTSNVALRIVDSYEKHPAKRLFDAGVSITINTDDYAVFGSSVSKELVHLTQMGFSEEDISKIRL